MENYIPLNDKTVGHVVDNILDIIRQLDEPEVLSQEWIDSNSVYASFDGVTEEYVHVDDLKELLVPKQELPMIPKYIADFIEVRKGKNGYSLRFILHTAEERDEKENYMKAYNWISSNDETFARAWLDGYTVEEEPKYYALVKGHELIKGRGNWVPKYWNLDTTDGDMHISDRDTVHERRWKNNDGKNMED